MRGEDLVVVMALVGVVAGLVACEWGGPTSSVPDDYQRVHLPAGDVADGRKAFAQLRCWSCHTVSGEEFPEPVASPATDVELGAAWDRRWTTQEFVTAILAPSHEISDAYAQAVVASGAVSRMGEYSHMEVRQLVDLAAFLGDVNRRVSAR